MTPRNYCGRAGKDINKPDIFFSTKASQIAQRAVIPAAIASAHDILLIKTLYLDIIITFSHKPLI